MQCIQVTIDANVLIQERIANAKVSARQHCVYEGL